MGKSLHDSYWSRINKGLYPDFDIILEFIQLLKKYDQEMKSYGRKDTNLITITLNDLMRTLADEEVRSIKGKELTRTTVSRCIHAFLQTSNITYHSQSGGGYTKFGQIPCTDELFENLDEWSYGVGMRRLFYSDRRTFEKIYCDLPRIIFLTF